MKLISIEGNIGCGKETFLNYIKELNPLATIFYESPELVQEKLKAYYVDPIKNAYTFQEEMIRYRIDQIKQAFNDKCDIVYQERSPTTDLQCFTKNWNEIDIIDDVQYLQLSKLVESFLKFLRDNHIEHLSIYLQTTVDICYKRIQKRERNGENQIKLKYLIKIHDKHEEIFNNQSQLINSDIIVVDNNSDVNEDFTKYIKMYNQIIDSNLCCMMRIFN